MELIEKIRESIGEKFSKPIVGTAMGEIVKNALIKWNNLSEEEAIEKVSSFKDASQASNEVTYGSETVAINKIAEMAKLTEKEKAVFIIDIYTRKEIRPEIKDKILRTLWHKEREMMPPLDMRENSLLSKPDYAKHPIYLLLSKIHDNWVKDNGNKFEARPKNYQFAPLFLLSYEEATADLIFLKPILEACDFYRSDEAIEEIIFGAQQDLLKANGIDSHESLVEKLRQGKEFYPALEGITTLQGGDKNDPNIKPVKITDLLRKDEIVQKMATQISEKAEKVGEYLAQNEHVSLNV